MFRRIFQGFLESLELEPRIKFRSKHRFAAFRQLKFKPPADKEIDFSQCLL